MKRELIESIELGGLRLCMYRRRRRLLAYGRDPGTEPLEVVIQDDRGEHAVATLAEVFDRAAQAGVTVATAAAANPASFASVLGHLAEVGRVVVEPVLYDFLDNEFDVAVANSAPRVEAGELLFLAGDFSLARARRLEEIRIDLGSGRLSRRPILPRA